MQQCHERIKQKYYLQSNNSIIDLDNLRKDTAGAILMFVMKNNDSCRESRAFGLKHFQIWPESDYVL